MHSKYDLKFGVLPHPTVHPDRIFDTTTLWVGRSRAGNETILENALGLKNPYAIPCPSINVADSSSVWEAL
jgi:hypothetical protein